MSFGPSPDETMNVAMPFEGNGPAVAPENTALSDRVNPSLGDSMLRSVALRLRPTIFELVSAGVVRLALAMALKWPALSMNCTEPFCGPSPEPGRVKLRSRW